MKSKFNFVMVVENRGQVYQNIIRLEFLTLPAEKVRNSNIVSGVWKKEDKLKQLKAEAASLERKIQLSFAPQRDGAPQQGNEQEVSQNPQQQQTPPLSQSQSASQSTDNDKRVVFALVAPPPQSKGVKL